VSELAYGAENLSKASCTWAILGLAHGSEGFAPTGNRPFNPNPHPSERRTFVALLTNRVHEPKVSHPIADVRNDLMDAVVLSITDSPSEPMNMPESFRSDTASYWNAKVVKKGTW